MKNQLFNSEKTLFVIIIVEIFCLIFFIFISALLLRYQHLGQEKFKHASRLRYESFLLADQLRHSSDDLTRMVRTYVATGDRIFEDYFWNILDIRDGKKPRPKNYERIYWDFMTAKAPTPPFRFGKRVALETLMKETGFTEKEFQLLKNAQKESDDLVLLENIAMHAMKGEFQNAKGEFSINGAPDLKMAMQLVFGEEYHKAKLKIMKPINVFFKMIDQRTSQNVALAISQVRFYQKSLICVFGMLVFNGLLILFTAKKHQSLMVNRLEYAIDQQSLELTERKRTEDALRDSEEKFRGFSEQSLVGIYLIQDSVFKYVNPKFAEIFGYANKRHLIGMPFSNAVHPDDRTTVKKHVHMRISKDVNSTNHAFRGIKKNGEIINVEIFGTSLLFKGKPAAIGTVLDITGRKKMELCLQQSQKMEAIGTLAGGIAHDFNNILFPIMGHTQMLMNDIGENSSIKTSLDKIYAGAIRARDLVSQILTFSRQESNELKSMKIQPIINEVLKLIRSTIPTSIEINSNIQADCNAVKADPTQIHQILMNLATNAYHAMEDTGGELNVNLKEVELSDRDLINSDMSIGTYVCLSVTDTGKGMDKELTQKIFDPFFTTKEQGKGTGMGLSVVHGIVTGIKGNIQVHSIPGRGTQFYVYIPIAKAMNKHKTTMTKSSIQGGSEHILLVDDEAPIIEIEREILEGLGYKVTSRTSSVEALNAFRINHDKFDMVITDMAMPNMSGDKLSVELLKLCPDIPILLCTGFSETMSEKQAASMGIKGFLLKPISMQNFSQKIREVLDGK